MKLAYKAYDKRGNVVVDHIDAASPAEARERLRRDGLFVSTLSEETRADRSQAGGGLVPSRRGARTRQLAVWTRQLSVLVRTGTPLAAAMASIERQVPTGPWRDVLADVRRRVEEGQTLSDAMGEHFGSFDDVSRSLVAAGESSGMLEEMLERVSAITRQQLKTRRTVVGALVYPALLLTVGAVVTLSMLLFVMPRFSKLFDSLGMPLPPVTEILMQVSVLLRSSWWIGLIALAVVAIGGRFAVRTPSGRRATHTMLVRAPFVGGIVRSLATARIARLLGVLLESHVALLESIELTRRASTNLLYVDLMQDAEEAAIRGESISGVFSRSSLISPSVAEAMHHGERNGQIGPILTDMADFLDEENEVIVKSAMSILEPVILVILGVVVGFIALSLFVPLFDMTSMAGAA
jgi:type II secretory pathway component PulF